MDLLDLLAEQGPRDPRLDVVHAVRPNMWGACGWCICGCAGASGAAFVLRRQNTDGVTCAACLEAMRVDPFLLPGQTMDEFKALMTGAVST